ncbi:MAG: nucleotide sugar dehydrogenase [Bdellovibrionales bacterium]
MTSFNVAVCGMSHLGLIYSTAFAAFGANVMCYDTDGDLVKKLAHGKKTVDEPDLYETISRNGARQRFSAAPDDIRTCDIVYVALDVATDGQGNSDLSGVGQMIEQVAPHLKADARLVILCQVMPGFTRDLSRKIPQIAYYQVETLVFGRAMERAMKPERYIIGCRDPAAGIDSLFRAWLELSECPIGVMSYESAELSKIAINLYLISSVSVSNMLAEMCEKIGADWADIRPSLHLDRRIGPYAYLKPGLGISGGNLERDMISIIRLGERSKTDTRLVSAWIDQSMHRKQWVLERLKEIFPDLRGLKIAVWGLAYKEDTNSIKNSPSVETIAALPACEVVAHDPGVQPHQVSFPNMTYARDRQEALVEADVLLIMTPWTQYKNYTAGEIVRQMAGRTIIDPYGLVDVSGENDVSASVHVMGKKTIFMGDHACFSSRIKRR